MNNSRFNLAHLAIPATLTAALLLSGCGEPAPEDAPVTPTMTVSAQPSICSVANEKSEDPRFVLLDCGDTPRDVLLETMRSRKPIEIANLGACFLVLAFEKPSEESAITAAYAFNCSQATPHPA